MTDHGVRVGLMGFGRIGRNLFRLLHDDEDVHIAAVSDTADHDGLVYLLRFDTIHGRFRDGVELVDDHLYSGGRRSRMLSGAEPGDVDWAAHGVDYVVHATGGEKAIPRRVLERHLERGARRVIVCVPCDEPDLTVVRGVNDDLLAAEHRIVSAASGTAQAAAPVLKVLADTFGIERAFLTTVHAYTNQQRLADVPAEDPRRGRAAAQNIIPQETNAGDVVIELLPALAGKLTASAINVPVPNGSGVDIVCWHEQPVTVETINAALRTAAGAERWGGVLEYEDDPIVSSDVLRGSHSATFDSQATMVLGGRISKTLTWFDNSWAYAHRVAELLYMFHYLDHDHDGDGDGGQRAEEVA